MGFLQTDIRKLKGVGEQRAKAFAKLGITDFGSLLTHFPRSYIDHRNAMTIAAAHSHIDETVSIIATILS